MHVRTSSSIFKISLSDFGTYCVIVRLCPPQHQHYFGHTELSYFEFLMCQMDVLVRQCLVPNINNVE